MIIDCHTHLNRYSTGQPEHLGERYALLRSAMDANGVGYAMVLTSYTVTNDRPSTEEVLDLVAGDPRFGVVAGVSVDDDLPSQIALLRSLSSDRRLAGLKLYPGYQDFHVHDRRLHPLYELAAEIGRPVMIHTGDTYNPRGKVKYAHPLEVDEVAVDFPEVSFLMGHLGNPWFADAMEVIYKNPNVVADVSGLTLGEFEPRFERFALRKVQEVVDFVNDPTKLLFGSDWPISGLASYLRFTAKLELTDEEREGLMWRNAARVFGLEVGAPGGGDAHD